MKYPSYNFLDNETVKEILVKGQNQFDVYLQTLREDQLKKRGYVKLTTNQINQGLEDLN